MVALNDGRPTGEYKDGGEAGGELPKEKSGKGGKGKGKKDKKSSKTDGSSSSFVAGITGETMEPASSLAPSASLDPAASDATPLSAAASNCEVQELGIGLSAFGLGEDSEAEDTASGSVDTGVLK